MAPGASILLEQDVQTTLGDWIAELYELALAELGDAELASVVTAILVEEHLVARARARGRSSAAA